MSSPAFDFRELHANEAASHTLEARVAQDTNGIEKAKAAVPPNPAAVEIANSIVITDETYGDAERQIVQWKLAIQEAERIFNPVCAAAHETHRKATGARASVIDPLNAAAGILSRKLAAYLAAKQRAEQEAERLRLEEARSLAALQRELEIEQAESAGASVEEVAALIDMPLAPVPLVSYTTRQKTASPVSLRQVWKGRVTGPIALVKHVAQNPSYLNLIQVDQSSLNKLAAALQSAAKLPGVEFYQETTTATRTAARRS